MSPEDQQFVTEFENLYLETAQFNHRGHLRLSWLYLGHFEFPVSHAKLQSGIRRYAGSLGAAKKYHRTMTYAFTCIVADRIVFG
jgi:hypothetical protein